MGLGIGLVGLPNVGKSTTFNALTKAQNAESANYPFCTIEPNKAVVPVPDSRLDELAKIVNPERIQHSTLDFVDIAGLVKGASKGEGLGNKFLGNIRETEVILHIVRCFEDENIVHTEGSIDPIRDVEIIDQELLFADMDAVEKRISMLTKKARGNDKEAKEQLVVAEALMQHIEENHPVSTFADIESDGFKAMNRDLRLLTSKEIIYGANVDEDGLAEDNEFVQKLRAYANERNYEVIKLCAKVEEDMVDFEDEERDEMLADLGVTESGLDQIIHKGFDKLGLMSYFTAGVKEGYYLSDLKYGNGKWVGVFSKGSQWNNQAYDVTERWESMGAEIEKRWEQGFYVVAIEQGLSEWVAVYAKNTGFTNQSFERQKKLVNFQNKIMQRWKEGFELLDVEYGEGHWLGIFIKGPDYGGHAMSLRTNWKRFREAIQKQWDAGYQISNLSFGVGKWLGTFANKTGYSVQGYETAPTVTELSQILRKRQEDGFALIDLAEGW